MAVAPGTALPYPPPPGLGGTEPPPAPTGAVTITAAQLAAATGTTEDGAAERVLPVAVRMVLDYAPAAPTEMLNEAVVRFGGYLLASDFGGVRTETLGPMSVEYQLNHAAAFRNSGAALLLTRYKVRRGGAVG